MTTLLISFNKSCSRSIIFRTGVQNLVLLWAQPNLEEPSTKVSQISRNSTTTMRWISKSWSKWSSLTTNSGTKKWRNSMMQLPRMRKISNLTFRNLELTTKNQSFSSKLKSFRPSMRPSKKSKKVRLKPSRFLKTLVIYPKAFKWSFKNIRSQRNLSKISI